MLSDNVTHDSSRQFCHPWGTCLATGLFYSLAFVISFQSHLTEIFNGLFAFLMLVVLVFFLIYGVEIFCKVSGDISARQLFAFLETVIS